MNMKKIFLTDRQVPWANRLLALSLICGFLGICVSAVEAETASQKSKKSQRGAPIDVLAELAPGEFTFQEEIKQREAEHLLKRLADNPQDTLLLTKASRSLLNSAGHGRKSQTAWAQSRTLLETCVKIQPNNGDALLMLGEMNLDEGKLKEAREFLERAAKCGARGNYSTLLSVLEMNERLIGKGVAPVILGKPNNEVVVQTNATSVRRLDPTGLPSDAQGSLSSVLIRRNDSAAWHRLAKTICPNGLTANAPDNHAIIALRSLEKAKALNPHDPSVCADLLELYLQSHAYDLAEIECEELLKLDPSNASGLKLKPLIKRMKDLSDKGNFPASQFGH